MHIQSITCVMLASWTCLAVQASPLPCAGVTAMAGPARPTETAGKAAPSAIVGTIEVVESVPIGTGLDLPELPNAPEVWRQLVAGAERALDIETFYFSGCPDSAASLETVLELIAAAAARGVKIRALSDAGFYRTYPEIPDRLNALDGAAYRSLPARRLWGGVLHAKFFLVDGQSFFVGSQNWDWRALEHIHELGVAVSHPALARGLLDIFELDWALAAGDAPPADTSSQISTAPAAGAISQAEASPAKPLEVRLATPKGDTVTAVLAASPPQGLPAGIVWDEPLLVELMDSARVRIRLQLLSYQTVDRDSEYYPALDNAIRRAAARGVTVRIILSNWAKRASMLPYIQSLAAVPNIEIRFTNIPDWSAGFISYARVDHAKFLVADDDACWIGTSNWAADYFHESRNVSLFVKGRGVAADLLRFFAAGWEGPYAETVDPCGDYQPPRIGE
jgi:phosphatidylserine/phosphatidylglycerophosphate/cardiolipin synthase-like enzyme